MSWHNIRDVYVLRKREIKKNFVRTQEIVISQKEGLLRDECYCMKIYSEAKINKLLKEAEFNKIKIQRNISLHRKKQDYGLITSRMIVKAIKSFERGS